MRKLMFVILAMLFVLAMSGSSAIGAPFLKWDPNQDGIPVQVFKTSIGDAFVVNLWVTDIPSDSPGASSFEIGQKFNPENGMKYSTNVLKCNSVTVNKHRRCEAYNH
jgi:hypothetical protein